MRKHEKNKDGYKNINNNTTKREWVKREMLCTLMHGRDTRYIPCTNNTVRVTSVIITGSKYWT